MSGGGARGEAASIVSQRALTRARPPRRTGGRHPAGRALSSLVVLMLACTAALVPLQGDGARHAAPSGRGLLGLPAGAPGPVSAALGRGQQAYRLVGLRALNPAQRLRATFSSRGVTVRSGRARVEMSLSAFGYGRELQPVEPARPHVEANRVSYSHGTLGQWYANGPLGLEQGFDVATAPVAHRGPLTIALALHGDLVPRIEHRSLLLAGRGVTLAYRGLRTTDARGRVLHSWLSMEGARLLIRVDDRGAAYPLRIDPFVQQAELTAKDGAALDELGYAVAVSGDTIVAGAPGHKVGAHTKQGAVYVFTRPAAGWSDATETAELIASDGGEKDGLGHSVAISGDTVVAGAQFHAVASVEHAGAAYVFTEPASGWAGTLTQSAELTASDAAKNDQLGYSVAISGDTVVAGARLREESRGAAYVFTKPASGWAGTVTQAAELTASDRASGDELGYSVAISGDAVVAGAREHTVGLNAKQGAAYVFTEPASGWTATLIQSAELNASDGGFEDYLGTSVAVSGDTVVAGSPNHGPGEPGAAYVFTKPASGWAGTVTQAAELTASDGAAEDDLGRSVAVSGSVVLAGAPGRDVPHEKQGAAYVFAMPASGWSDETQTEELSASDGAVQDELGSAVAVSGATIAAGAPRHEVSSESEQGAAYAVVAPLPSIAIGSPADGASYIQGQAVAAAFACAPPGGASILSCAGPVANGAPIDTSTPGSHTFTVQATDSDGLSASGQATYTVLAPPPPAPPLAQGLGASVAPRISSLRQSARRWREGHALARVSARARVRVGTTFSFVLSEAAGVSFRFSRLVGGRRAGRRCVAPTRRNRHARRCVRALLAGTLSFHGHSGPNAVRFQGRISARRRLRPGSYSLQVSASAAGKRSTPGKLRFTIVRG